MLRFLISFLLLTVPILSVKPDFSELDKLMLAGTASAFPGGVIVVANEKEVIY